jgi:hypothetical protein
MLANFLGVLPITQRHSEMSLVLTPVILATQEAEIRKTVVQSQTRQIVQETLCQKTHYKKRAGGMAQVLG